MKLWTLSVALLSVASYISSGMATGENSFQLALDYHVPKNIAFSCHFGGSSHVVWVLSILEELAARGHHTIFYTRDDHAKFIKNFPTVELVSAGPAIVEKETYKNGIRVLSSDSHIDSFLCIMKALMLNFTDITSTHILNADAIAPYINIDFLSMHNPTSKNVPFFERLRDKVINLIRLLIKARGFIKEFRQEQRALGLEPTSGQWHIKFKDSIKMFNTAFGFDPPRPIGPLIELIGPILPKTRPVLTDDLQQFLGSHKKVVYVAFGQHAVLSTEELGLIMASMLENMETGDIDGILWSVRDMEHLFPETLQTRSGQVYRIRDLFDKKEGQSILFLEWAPQVAILHHPSTQLFLTHGGSASVYEALYNGVPIVIYPFFTDQPAAAVIAEENGYGRWMKKSDQEQAIKVVQEVLRDDRYRLNANRFKALVQIRSNRGVQRGADVVEEALYLHQDGKINHRRDVRRDLSFLKAYNLDLYLFSLSVIFGSLFGVYRLVSYGLKRSSVKAKKMKSA
ncbi:hypothetical protein RO3G_14946 [Rhizopus delemar RA 99-880]|uniref:Uncharacterized protein n=1 Tax=Rhizopus delemar (strain RA 99-880 / ATCC MYA-4621 / FGSC 9543 / NRRL 43880) TaxID=246409 RepID=I1CP55_RHIO9|nr:hypothetical protein RO3G_14946 [Rhizopus delemar RA 99-880]|eukprot:EIE90235.1 hypothetical protein RO3G_14946 [Rhizopus delemar RA 99-880]